MKLIVTFLLICACFIGTNTAEWKHNIEKWCGLKYCQFYESALEEYRHYFELKDVHGCQPPGYLVKFEFYAVGYKNAHVIFSTHPFPNVDKEKIYEIVIGYEYLGKTMTTIRQHRIYGDMKNEETKNVLNPHAPNLVAIGITDIGAITVDVNNVTVAVAYDSQPIPIKYFSFRSFESTNVQYFYDCKNENSNVIVREI